MNGIGAQLNARVWRLPVWAWALLIVLAIVAVMWWKKIGFFAPATAQDTMRGDSSNPGMSSADYPAGLGGIAGAGTPAGSTDPTFSVPGAYSPGTAPFATTDNAGNSLSTPGNVSSQPTIDLSSSGSPTLTHSELAPTITSNPLSAFVSAIPQTLHLSGRRGGNIAQ